MKGGALLVAGSVGSLLSGLTRGAGASSLENRSSSYSYAAPQPSSSSAPTISMTTHRSIDSGAEGGCAAKGPDAEFTLHRAPHESHSMSNRHKTRYSVGILVTSLFDNPGVANTDIPVGKCYKRKRRETACVPTPSDFFRGLFLAGTSGRNIGDSALVPGSPWCSCDERQRRDAQPRRMEV